jgi:hypothetical protein
MELESKADEFSKVSRARLVTKGILHCWNLRFWTEDVDIVSIFKSGIGTSFDEANDAKDFFGGGKQLVMLSFLYHMLVGKRDRSKWEFWYDLEENRNNLSTSWEESVQSEFFP